MTDAPAPTPDAPAYIVERTLFVRGMVPGDGRLSSTAKLILEDLDAAGFAVVPKVATKAMWDAFDGARPETATPTEDGGWTAPLPDWRNASWAAAIAAGAVKP